MLTRQIRTGILFSLVLAFVVMTAIALYADLPQMLGAVVHFRWLFLPLILVFTLFNYFCRFFKWQYYLKRLNLHLPWLTSLLIFMSGLSMAITPGKIGELLKAYLLKQTTGAPISRTSPIIVAERLSDGIAMLLLAATGLALYRFGWELLVLFLVVGMGAILIIQNRRLSLAILSYGERIPFMHPIAHLLRAFYESSYTLLQWRPLLLAVAIGFLSWSGECAALYFVFTGLGIAPTPDLFIKSTFILSVSSLIGSASGLPGGLGTADGSMLGLTRLLVTSSATLGGAATLLIRLCTLWFGLGLGVVALLIFRSTQHTKASTDEDGGWEEEQQLKNSPMPANAPDTDEQPKELAHLTSAALQARNGDKPQ